MKNQRKNTYFLITGALIAAIYVVLSFASFGFSSGMVQCRISEAFTVLAAYTPAAIPGLFVGCIITNLVLGNGIWDVIFGSFATLLAALISYRIRKLPCLAPIPVILINTVVVPAVLCFTAGAEKGYLVLCGYVFVGEIISSGFLGLLLIFYIEKTKTGKNLKKILQNPDF